MEGAAVPEQEDAIYRVERRALAHACRGSDQSVEEGT
jgi:hypothetical protein